jgi:hypothetical protein
MRTAFTALLAAFMLTAPAAANPYYTIETTFIASPGVIQVGDQAIFTLTMSLLADPSDAAAGVTVQGSAWGGFANINDGNGDNPGGPILGPSLPGLPPYVVNFRSSPYQTPGDFLVTITGQVEISLTCSPTSTVCPQFANPYDTFETFGGRTSVSVAPVPGPVLGAGLPGFLILCASALAWWRRRSTSPVIR